MTELFDPDTELRVLKELFDEIYDEHERLQRKRPIDADEHERHRAKIRALLESVHAWRRKHTEDSGM